MNTYALHGNFQYISVPLNFMCPELSSRRSVQLPDAKTAGRLQISIHHVLIVVCMTEALRRSDIVTFETIKCPFSCYLNTCIWTYDRLRVLVLLIICFNITKFYYYIPYILNLPHEWTSVPSGQPKRRKSAQKTAIKFTEFTEASSTADTAGMSRHRLAPYTVHYLKTLLILVISGS